MLIISTPPKCCLLPQASAIIRVDSVLSLIGEEQCPGRRQALQSDFFQFWSSNHGTVLRARIDESYEVLRRGECRCTGVLANSEKMLTLTCSFCEGPRQLHQASNLTSSCDLVTVKSALRT